MLDLTDNLAGDRVVRPRKWCATTVTIRTSSWPPTRGPRPSRYSPTASPPSTVSGSATPSPPAGPQATTTRHGITARGAWESVKRHFRALGVNVQSTDFTVMGIGDMSGDVFGNGMLLSRHIKLVGAFNHMHIFLDPKPDPETSFEERARLFGLPRSSWTDYDQDLISEGGGVFPRSAKSIPLSPGVRELLDVEDEALTPNEVVNALLKARVDLLWNGGIGTYVKASSETNAGSATGPTTP